MVISKQLTFGERHTVLIPICAEHGVRNSTLFPSLWKNDMSDRSGESSLVLVLLHRGCCRRVVLSVSIVDLEAGTNLRGMRRHLQRWAFIVIPSPMAYIYIYTFIHINKIQFYIVFYVLFWWCTKIQEDCWVPWRSRPSVVRSPTDTWKQWKCVEFHHPGCWTLSDYINHY